MWWNVYVQFQTKITDDLRRAGIPWAADDLLVPLTEAEDSVSAERQMQHLSGPFAGGISCEARRQITRVPPLFVAGPCVCS